jgi:hypothetical protein
MSQWARSVDSLNGLASRPDLSLLRLGYDRFGQYKVNLKKLYGNIILNIKPMGNVKIEYHCQII